MDEWVEYAISELDRVTECDAANAVREMLNELRTTKRALWLARYMRASEKDDSLWHIDEDSYEPSDECKKVDMGRTQVP